MVSVFIFKLKRDIFTGSYKIRLKFCDGPDVTSHNTFKLPWSIFREVTLIVVVQVKAAQL